MKIHASKIILSLFLLIIFSRCGKEMQTPKVDFTIDLTQAQYNVLYNIGGFIKINGIIIIHDLNNEYIALSEYCTFDNTELEYLVSYDYLHCASDNSSFHDDGTVLLGPASVPLVTYYTQLYGTSLRIYNLQ